MVEAREGGCYVKGMEAREEVKARGKEGEEKSTTMHSHMSRFPDQSFTQFIST